MTLTVKEQKALQTHQAAIKSKFGSNLTAVFQTSRKEEVINYLKSRLSKTLKEKVLQILASKGLEEAANYLAERLGIPSIIARHLVKQLTNMAVKKVKSLPTRSLPPLPKLTSKTSNDVGLKGFVSIPENKILPLLNDDSHLFPRKSSTAAISYGAKVLADAPRIETRYVGGEEQTRIVGTTLIQSVVGVTSTYTPDNVEITPTYFAFKRVAEMAKNYNQWQANSVAFEFVPACPSTSSGSLIQCYLPDSNSDSPETFAELMEQDGARLSNVWAPSGPFKLDPRALRAQEHYVRQGAVPDGSDINLYQAGNYIFAFQDLNSELNGTVIGYIICHYDFTFCSPYYDIRQWAEYDTKIGNDASAAATDIFGSSTVVGSLNIDYTTSLNTLIFNEAGIYCIHISLGGTSPTMSLSGSSTVARNTSNKSDQLGGTPEGKANVFTVIASQPGQTAIFTIGGTVSESVWSVCRGGGYLIPNDPHPDELEERFKKFLEFEQDLEFLSIDDKSYSTSRASSPRRSRK